MAESSGVGVLGIGVGAETGLKGRALSRFPPRWVSVGAPVWAAEARTAQGGRGDLEPQKAHQDLWAWRRGDAGGEMQRRDSERPAGNAASARLGDTSHTQSFQVM